MLKCSFPLNPSRSVGGGGQVPPWREGEAVLGKVRLYFGDARPPSALVSTWC